MDEAERRRALEEAVRDAVAERPLTPAEQRLARRGTPGDRRRRLALVIILGWAVIAWLWLTRPAFFFGPSPAPVASAARQEATLRFAMYLQRRRVDDYLAVHGRLPATLQETGAVEDSVRWQRTGEGYVLLGQYGPLRLELPSRVDADSFLGNSLAELQQ